MTMVSFFAHNDAKANFANLHAVFIANDKKIKEERSGSIVIKDESKIIKIINLTY